MGSIAIIEPIAATNLVTNPSFELGTTGWSADSGVTMASSAGSGCFGAKGLSVSCSSSNTGVRYNTISLGSSGASYAMSAYLYVPIGSTVRMFIGSSNTTPTTTVATMVGNGRWQRLEQKFTSPGGTGNLYFVSTTTGSFFLDAVQVEAGTFSTYIDGDQDGCSWNGAIHGSTSTRDAGYRGGGNIIDLESIGVYLISQSGTGMAAVKNNTKPYATRDGSYFQDQHAIERSLTLAFSVTGNDTLDWHAKRARLIELIRPDATGTVQPFKLVYRGAVVEKELDCVYDSGLDMSDSRQQIETVGIKLLAPNPYWQTRRITTVAQTSISLFPASYFQYRDTSGLWHTFTGTSTSVSMSFGRCLAIDGDNIYVAAISGSNLGGTGHTIARYSIHPESGSNWHAMGLGSLDTCYAVAASSNHDVFVVGGFTSIGGASSSARVARWNFSSNTWTGLSYPGTTTVVDCVVGTDGTLYTNDNTRIYMYKNSSWTLLATAGTGTNTYGMCIGPDGCLYVVGSFSNLVTPLHSLGITMNGLAKYTPFATTPDWVNLLPSNPYNHDSVKVTDVCFGSDNNIYLGISDTPFLARVLGNGSTTVAISNVGVTPFHMISAKDAVFHVVGQYASAATPIPESWQTYTGSTVRVGGAIVPALGICSIAERSDGLLVLSYNGTGNGYVPANNTVRNYGSATALPKITIKNNGATGEQLYYIRNATTNKILYVDSSVLNNGEVITIDLSKNRANAVSSFRGTIPLGRGSQPADFGFIPGDNRLDIFATSNNVVVTFEYHIRYWSADDAGISEGLL